jgi:hypothetical protein
VRVEEDLCGGSAQSQIRSRCPLLIAALEPASRRSSSSVEVAREQEVILHVLVGHDMAWHDIGEVDEYVVLSVSGLVQQRDGAGRDRDTGQEPGDVQRPGGRPQVGRRDGVVWSCR